MHDAWCNWFVHSSSRTREATSIQTTKLTTPAQRTPHYHPDAPLPPAVSIKPASPTYYNRRRTYLPRIDRVSRFPYPSRFTSSLLPPLLSPAPRSSPPLLRILQLPLEACAPYHLRRTPSPPFPGGRSERRARVPHRMRTGGQRC